MNRIRLLTVGTVLALALAVTAQQASTAPAGHPSGLPTVEQHLRMLSEKLDLTSDQQEKARPILKEMQDAMARVMEDKSLTHEQMHEQMRPAQTKADKQLREFLTDEQKSKLDQLEADQHHTAK